MNNKTTTRGEEIIARRDQYMTINYGRYPIAMMRGEGCRLWDADDKQYLDLFSGFGAGVLGHCHPDLVKAVTDQANALWHVGNLFHTEPQTLAAEAIAKHGFGGRSFFCHSGADANEAAFKLARLYGRANPAPSGNRYKVISATNSFHGRSFASMVATGQKKVREGFEPWLPGFSNVEYNSIEAIEKAMDDQTVAVIVEPIQGEGGVNVPDADYLPRLRALCDKRDMLLICDEVWTGCGRTGKYFAHQHWDITPDIMTLAKGVGGGLAVGVMCANERAAKYFDHREHGTVAHATTLGGNCLSMAVTAAIFRVMERDGLVDQAAEHGSYVIERLTRFAATNKVVKQVRGKGLFLGVQLDPEHDGDRKGDGATIVKTCMDRGLLINATQGTILRIAPPLIVTREQLDEGLDILEDVLGG